MFVLFGCNNVNNNIIIVISEVIFITNVIEIIWRETLECLWRPHIHTAMFLKFLK